MLRYKTETRPGLVALYDIQFGPKSRTRKLYPEHRTHCICTRQFSDISYSHIL